MPDGPQRVPASEQRPDSTHRGRDALAADACAFAETLEDAHPDPYTGHGGRVEFHRRLEELLRELPERGESEAAFARRLQRFAARVRDGHTKVVVPEGAAADVDGRLPLDFRVVGDALYVEAVYEHAHEDLLGGRLQSVDGVSLPELRERMALTESSDNVYGDRYSLCGALGPDPGTLAVLLGDGATEHAFTVECPDGQRVERVLEPTRAENPIATLDRTVAHPDTSGEPAYTMLEDGDAALLTIPDCQTHREPLEAAFSMYDDVPDVYDHRETYRQVVGEPVPEDNDDVVAGIPAATEVFASLAEAMAAAETETLVVDTRGNNGGSSLTAYLLAYVLYGSDGVGEAAIDQYSVSKDSRAYRRQYGDDGPVASSRNPAGFDFESYFRRDSESAAAILDELTAYSETAAAAVEDGEYDGYYAPENVVVVTDAGTFSAGLEPAILLSKLGATVAGVPSAQAANGPRDVLVDDLPNTGLEVRISYRHHVFQPCEDGTVFEPDLPLTAEAFEARGRANDASIALALDAAADGSAL